MTRSSLIGSFVFLMIIRDWWDTQRLRRKRRREWRKRHKNLRAMFRKQASIRQGW